MCSLIAFLFLAECHTSKNSLLFHWGHLSIIVKLSRSKTCPVCCLCLVKREFRLRVAMARECSRCTGCLPNVNSTAIVAAGGFCIRLVFRFVCSAGVLVSQKDLVHTYRFHIVAVLKMLVNLIFFYILPPFFLYFPRNKLKLST